MITAKEAGEISDIFSVQNNEEYSHILKIIDEKIRENAEKGLRCVEISLTRADKKIIKYFEFLGYNAFFEEPDSDWSIPRCALYEISW